VNLLRDFQANVTRPINVYEDNSGVVAMAKLGNFTKNSKHIEVHYHFVHECGLRKVWLISLRLNQRITLRVY